MLRVCFFLLLPLCFAKKKKWQKEIHKESKLFILKCLVPHISKCCSNKDIFWQFVCKVTKGGRSWRKVRKNVYELCLGFNFFLFCHFLFPLCLLCFILSILSFLFFLLFSFWNLFHMCMCVLYGYECIVYLIRFD